MSFQLVTPWTGTQRQVEGVVMASNGKQVAIIVGRDVMDEMGWEYGDRIAIYVGRLKDDGFIRLEKSDQGWKLTVLGGGKTSSRAGTMRVACKVFPHLRSDSQGRTPCKHSVTPGKAGVLVHLPKWACNLAKASSVQ